MTLPADVNVTTHADGNKLYRRGTILNGAIPSNAGPYQVGNISILSHGWFQAWTDRTASPLTIKRTPAQIVAANRAFQYGNTGLKVDGVANDSFTGPMDNAGVYKYMAGTGERPDIGLVTDAVGQFMLAGAPGPMLAWAQAADGVPINYVDESTGKPIDLTRYPQANTYDGNQGLPRWDKGLPDPSNSFYHGYADGWTVDTNHFPSLCFTAFQATKDIGLLYNLQHFANFTSISDAYNCSPGGGAVVHDEQMRQLAWGFRMLFEAHIATKDAEVWGILPADLHPSSYFKTLLDNNLRFYSPHMADPTRAVFRVIGPRNNISPWQTDYLLTALAFGILTGHSDWLALYLWSLKNWIDRTSNKSGWPPAICTPYRMYGPGDGVPSYAAAFAGMINYPFEPAASITHGQYNALLAEPLNGGRPSDAQPLGYIMTTRAVGVMASYLDDLGLANVRDTYPDFDTCLTNVQRMFLTYDSVPPRVSVVSTAPIDVPPPVTTPPAQGEITVTDIVFNAPFTATADFKDNLGNPMVPDSVLWAAPDSFNLTPDQNNPLIAHGVYGVAGASTIQAVGGKAGVSVTVTKEVSVPEAVPFLAGGEIILS